MKTLILDFETSGLNPFYTDILEIGAKVLNSNDTFEILLKPQSGSRISHRITELTGITPKMLYFEGRDWKNAYSEFYNWLYTHLHPEETNTIVCHNGDGFDFTLLKRIFNDVSESHVLSDYDIVFLDTLPISRRLYLNFPCFKQVYLATRLKVPYYGEHRALADVCTLEHIYKDITKHLEKRGITESRDMVRYSKLEI